MISVIQRANASRELYGILASLSSHTYLYEFLNKHRKRKDRQNIRLFNKDVADSNTLLMTLVLILVSAGEVVLDDIEDDLVQPGLAVISHSSSHIF